MQIMKHLITTVGEPKMKGGGERVGRRRTVRQRKRVIQEGGREGKVRGQQKWEPEIKEWNKGKTGWEKRREGRMWKAERGRRRGEGTGTYPDSESFVWYVLPLTKRVARMGHLYKHGWSPEEPRCEFGRVIQMSNNQCRNIPLVYFILKFSVNQA